MSKSINTVFILILSIASLTGCSFDSNSVTQQSLDSLIVLPAAKKVKKNEISGSTQVFYQLHEKYPAQNTISHIENRLKSLGWTQIEYNELNLNAPTSLINGWTISSNPTKEPGDEVHIWDSVWKNELGEYIKYQFQYFSPKDRIKEQELLLVAAILVPSKRAKQLKRQMDDILEKNK